MGKGKEAETYKEVMRDERGARRDQPGGYGDGRNEIGDEIGCDGEAGDDDI